MTALPNLEGISRMARSTYLRSNTTQKENYRGGVECAYPSGSRQYHKTSQEDGSCSMARYNIDIAAISETRLAEKGSVSEPGSGYTTHFSGRKELRARKEHMVLDSPARPAFSNSFPTGINERSFAFLSAASAL